MSILVSVVCTTYNHEKYISDAIESFLMQQTNFDFEILIGEDCSTDNTRQIVEEYVRKNPNKIKIITSNTNVGPEENENRLLEKAQGKYLALCEGDDYWTDSKKLQKQVDYLEKNPECSLVFHATEFVNVSKESIGTIARIDKESRIVKMDEICLKATPSFIPTGSRLYRKHLTDNLPGWYQKTSIGDFPSALIIANYGYFFYMDEVMSAYRTGVEGSWTNRTLVGKEAIRNDIEINKECIQILNDFNDYSNYQFKRELEKAKKIREIKILLLERKIKVLKHSKIYKDYYLKLSLKEKIILNLNYYFPKFYQTLSNIIKHQKNVSPNKMGVKN